MKWGSSDGGRVGRAEVKNASRRGIEQGSSLRCRGEAGLVGLEGVSGGMGNRA